MHASIQNYIESNHLFQKTDKLLVAVSGGLDSIVCFHLLKQLGYSLAIAHCNFNLRGKESDADEDFVRDTGNQTKTIVHVQSFDTKEFAKQQSRSIQMAARALRMTWFEELRQLEKYDYIVIAHQADDSIETIFINLIRGTGIKGLTGIQPISGVIRRPLLFASREEIARFARNENIPYREDSSNIKTEYTRNRIRHLILPEIYRLNPGFRQTAQRVMKNLQWDLHVLEDYFLERKEQLVLADSNEIRIAIKPLLQEQRKEWILYKILAEYAFNSQQTDLILKHLGENTGKQFFSPAYELTVDREYIFIRRQIQASADCFQIPKDLASLSTPIPMEFSVFERSGYQIPQLPQIAALDYDLLTFPLQLDHWREGDTFYPLGLNQKQKLSDYFINEKIPRHHKKDIWILRSAGEIVWIVGYRLDHRFRISEQTKKIWQIQILV